jgi:uncharacterized protein DUF6895
MLSLTGVLDATLDYALDVATFDAAVQMGFGPDAPGPLGRAADKVVAEAALLGLIAARTRRPETLRRVHELAQRLSPRARDARTAAALVRHPAAVSAIGVAHRALDALGHSDLDFDRVLEHAESQAAAAEPERLPFRAMDRRWTAALATGHPAVMDDLLAGTLLVRPVHPVYLERSDAYAWTHAAFYVADFGSVAPPVVLDPALLVTALRSMLSWTLASADYDLAVELVIAARVLRLPVTAHEIAARHVVLDTWNRLGRLPGPCHALAERPDDPHARRAYDVATCYHTVFVLGLAAAVDTVMEPLAPPSSPVATDGPLLETVIEQLIPLLSVDPACDWLEGLRAAPIPDAERARIMIEGVVIQACRAGDLGLLATSCAIALEFGVAPRDTLRVVSHHARGRLLAERELTPSVRRLLAETVRMLDGWERVEDAQAAVAARARRRCGALTWTSRATT